MKKSNLEIKNHIIELAKHVNWKKRMKNLDWIFSRFTIINTKKISNY